jgi:hypothetical protein
MAMRCEWCDDTDCCCNDFTPCEDVPRTTDVDPWIRIVDGAAEHYDGDLAIYRPGLGPWIGHVLTGPAALRWCRATGATYTGEPVVLT